MSTITAVAPVERESTCRWVYRRSDVTSAEPAPFREAVAAMNAVTVRPEIELGPIRPPQRLAPFSYALGAEVKHPDLDIVPERSEGDAFGRLILLYDPDGSDAWDGTMRLVAYIQADLDSTEAVDPLLPEVAWSWLADALESRSRAGHRPGRHRHRHHVGAVRRHLRTAARPPAGAAGLVDGDHPRGRRPCRGVLRGAGARGGPATGRGRRPGLTVTRLTCPKRRPKGPASTEPDHTPLLHPAEGMPDLSVTASQIAAAAELLDRGHGPFAVDAERASGFRYSNRAYLIQIRRTGAGTVLIDPVSHGVDPLTALRPVAEVLSTDEWILHSADQDLPCLAEVGMRPPALYDTELAGRLAGFDRVNLATMVQRLLGFGLAKGHGAADWSKRPLPAEWLNYAALDVELLIELRAAISRILAEQGKTDWAAQEFEHLRIVGPREATPAARAGTLAPNVGDPSGA